jgi:hypothetical protein
MEKTMKPVKLVEGEKPEVDKWLNSVLKQNTDTERLLWQLKDWADNMDEDHLGMGGDIIDELYELFFKKQIKMFLTDKQLSEIAQAGWKPLLGKTGVAWFGGKTHSTLANQVSAEDLEHFEDLNFLVVAYQRASQDG